MEYIVFSTIEFKTWPVTSVIIQQIKRTIHDDGVNLPSLYIPNTRSGSETKNTFPDQKLSRLLGQSKVQETLQNYTNTVEGFNPNLMRGNPTYELIKNRSISVGPQGEGKITSILNATTMDMANDKSVLLIQEGQDNMRKDYRSKNFTTRANKEKRQMEHRVVLEQSMISRTEQEIWNQKDPIRPNKLGSELLDRKPNYSYKTVLDDLIGIPSNYERYRRKNDEKVQFQNSMKPQHDSNYATINSQYAETLPQHLPQYVTKKSGEKSARENRVTHDVPANSLQNQLPKQNRSHSQKFASPAKSEIQNRANPNLAPIQHTPTELNPVNVESKRIPHLAPSFGALPKTNEADHIDYYQREYPQHTSHRPVQHEEHFPGPAAVHPVIIRDQYGYDPIEDSDNHMSSAKFLPVQAQHTSNRNTPSPSPHIPHYLQHESSEQSVPTIRYEVTHTNVTSTNIHSFQHQNLSGDHTPKEKPAANMKESVNMFPNDTQHQPTAPPAEKKGYARPPSPHFQAKPRSSNKEFR